MTGSRYAAAGVDLAAADDAKARIGELVAATRTPLSAGRVGAFGGMVRVPEGMRHPLLVMSTDGVGTKVLVAEAAGVFDTVGEDLVNHSVNDILVHGARAIAFMDYVAGHRLPVDMIEGIVAGIARGCVNHGMALAGGETAQMPGVYPEGTFDLAGTIIGVVEEDAAIHGDAVAAGDVLLAYASTGLHTNGYTLARRVLLDEMGLLLQQTVPELRQTLAEALLAVHRSYVAALAPVLDRIHGMAHITGGGIAGNLSRVLPATCDAVVDPNSWEWPALFRLIGDGGNISESEMRDVFNLGVGMIAVIPADAVAAVESAARAADVPTWRCGAIVAGSGAARFA
ncbi:MAG TPA: phosphoribosylformylglycinamidine cyclo-ligase [Gemmatimonadales bacterium]|jgi:phosphoribosylformylglycinamidine cyclo-ligase